MCLYVNYSHTLKEKLATRRPINQSSTLNLNHLLRQPSSQPNKRTVALHRTDNKQDNRFKMTCFLVSKKLQVMFKFLVVQNLLPRASLIVNMNILKFQKYICNSNEFTTVKDRPKVVDKLLCHFYSKRQRRNR